MDWLQFLSGVFGLLGSVALAVPAFGGAYSAQALDAAEAELDADRAAARKLSDESDRQKALDSAWAAYVATRDGILVKAIGGHRWIRRWNRLGVGFLVLAFICLLGSSL